MCKRLLILALILLCATSARAQFVQSTAVDAVNPSGTFGHNVAAGNILLALPGCDIGSVTGSTCSNSISASVINDTLGNTWHMAITCLASPVSGSDLVFQARAHQGICALGAYERPPPQFKPQAPTQGPYAPKAVVKK